jgi:hypothetical protein
MYRSLSLRPAVLALGLLAGCGASSPQATPCDQVVTNCDARRLENVVLLNGATDGSLFSVEGLDTSGVLSFDEALEAAWRNDYRGDSETVQVILGASDVWGTGTNLYFGVKWGGVCPMDRGPTGSAPAGPPNCSGVWGTVIDARTREFVVSGM